MRYIVTTKHTDLRIRSEPNDESRILGGRAQGDPVEIDVARSRPPWMKLADRSGWVHGRFLRRADDAAGGAGATAGAAAVPQLESQAPVLPGPLQRLKERILADAPSPQSKRYQEQQVHVVMLPDSAGMKLVARDPTTTLIDTIQNDREARSGLVVSGSFFGVWGGVLGTLVENGRAVHRGHAPDGAFLGFAGAGHYVFGLGDTQMTQAGRPMLVGLGGLVAMIIAGADAPRNPWYLENNHRSGRCIVASRPSARQLAVVAQKWADPPFILDQFTEFLKQIDCVDAVALDGSDSAMLRYRNTWYFPPSGRKSRFNPNAVAFYGFSSQG